MDQAETARPDAFQVADRTVFPLRNRVLGPKGEVHLEPRVMDTLCALAARGGEVMSRDSLISAVWGVRYGGDESLTRAVSILRKALGPAAIETVAKRGYRLAQAVEWRGSADTHSDSPAVIEAPRAQASYALRLRGRGPNRAFPVASLDIWRLPPLAFAIAPALAIGLAVLDAAS